VSDDEDLGVALQSDIESLALALLGLNNRKLSSRKELRFGTNGSIAVALQGSKRASWFDHEAGYGGGPLQLIVHARECSYDEAEAWARDWIKMPAMQREREAVHPAAALLARLRGTTGTDDDDEKRRITGAQALWAASAALAGSLGERYLAERRGIPAPEPDWPGAVRFHAASRALIVAATADDGAVRAVQRVLLTDDARKVSREDAGRLSPPTNKRTDGVQEGAAVRLPGSPDGPVLLAEGPETGLSVWAATGLETWIALGSMKRLQPPAGRRIVVCRDDDVRYSPAERAVTGAMHDWKLAGLDIVGVTPWRIRRHDGSDFNDAIREQGAGAIRDAINRALDQHGGASTRLRQHADNVRWGMALGACQLFAIATEVPPEYWTGELRAIGCRVDTGIGKSAIARAAAAEALVLMRSRGNNRTIAIAVPTHKLGEEQASAFRGLARARKAGLEAAVWRGREADDPEEPGETMCRNLPAVRDAMTAGLDVQSAACRRVEPGVPDLTCPFFGQCGYQRQRRQRADLWIVPHETLFVRKPEAIGDLAALVVDEAAWQSGLVGVGAGRGVALALDALEGDATVPGAPVSGERLTFLRRRLLDALRSGPDGPLSRAALLAAGLTPESAREARTLEWRRRADIGIVPGIDPQQRTKLAASSPNAIISRLAMLWRAIEALLADGGPEASGWAALAEAKTDHGPVRVLRLKGREPIGEGWRVPALVIDANLNADLVKPYWPIYWQAVDLAAVTPWQRVRQAIGHANSKARLLPAADGKGALAGPNRRDLRRVAAILGREARRHASPALIVANKAVETEMPAVWRKPPDIDIAHFNAVAGRDGWRSVGFLATVGSTNPPPSAVEELAEALTGEHVTPLAGWYETAATARETADGRCALAETDRHPHPIAEAIRWQIREGEVIQAIGRARGVNRTAADPVDVLVMTDAVLPLPVEPVEAADMDPSPADMMLAAGGVALDNPAHAAAAYPALWPSVEAARKAFQRARSGTIPYKVYIRPDCPRPHAIALARLAWADYQLVGAGQHLSVAWLDPTIVPDLAGWLHGRLGEMAICRVTMPSGGSAALP
jgi:putative DNA primase/helicase